MAARVILQAQWVLFFVAAMGAPLVLRWLPVGSGRGLAFIGLALAVAVASSVHAWRTRGRLPTDSRRSRPHVCSVSWSHTG